MPTPQCLAWLRPTAARFATAFGGTQAPYARPVMVTRVHCDAAGHVTGVDYVPLTSSLRLSKVGSLRSPLTKPLTEPRSATRLRGFQSTSASRTFPFRSIRTRPFRRYVYRSAQIRASAHDRATSTSGTTASISRRRIGRPPYKADAHAPWTMISRLGRRSISTFCVLGSVESVGVICPSSTTSLTFH